MGVVASDADLWSIMVVGGSVKDLLYRFMRNPKDELIIWKLSDRKIAELAEKWPEKLILSRIVKDIKRPIWFQNPWFYLLMVLEK